MGELADAVAGISTEHALEHLADAPVRSSASGAGELVVEGVLNERVHKRVATGHARHLDEFFSLMGVVTDGDMVRAAFAQL